MRAPFPAEGAAGHTLLETYGQSILEKEITLDGAAVGVNFVTFDEGFHHRHMRLRGIGAGSANPGGCAGY